MLGHPLHMQGTAQPQRRGFATSSSGGGSSEEKTFTDDSGTTGMTDAVDTSSSSSSVDATLERLFAENVQNQQLAEQVASTSMEFVPTWWYFSDQCINLIFQFQALTGTELGVAIVGTTLAVRTCLFPIVLSTQKSASRMAHVQPELEQLKRNFEKIRNPTAEDKVKMGKRVQELFRRYEVSPVRSMLMPFVQFPFFLGMFFGLKKMPDYFANEMATGGMLWFPDLTQTAVLNWTMLGFLPEPNMTWMLPTICMGTFVASIELGKEQMMASNPQMAGNVVMFFRFMMIPMVYILTTFHAGLLCYWTVNNVFTLVQISTLKNPAVKKAAGIWDAPKPVPGQATQSQGLKEAMEYAKKYASGEPTTEAGKMEQHNQRIEQQKKQAELTRQSRSNRSGRRSIKRR